MVTHLFDYVHLCRVWFLIKPVYSSPQSVSVTLSLLFCFAVMFQPLCVLESIFVLFSLFNKSLSAATGSSSLISSSLTARNNFL